MTPPKKTAEKPTDLPIAEEAPEDQVQGMATPDDLEDASAAEEETD